MKIKRIELNNVGGVKHCNVNFNVNGITVIHGPNEIGKSTIVKAFDAVFKYPDSSRDRRVMALKPVGKDVGPEITIEFFLKEQNYLYKKRFLKEPITELRIQNKEVLSGRDAHEEINNILSQNFDKNLFDALRYIQGGGIENIKVQDSEVFLKALDKAAGGTWVDLEKYGDLFQAIKTYYENYYPSKNTRRKGQHELKKSDLDQLKEYLNEINEKIEAQKQYAIRIEELQDEIKKSNVELQRKDEQLKDCLSKLEDYQKRRQQLSEKELEIQRLINKQNELKRKKDRLNEIKNELSILEKQKKQLDNDSTELQKQQVDCKKSLKMLNENYSQLSDRNNQIKNIFELFELKNRLEDRKTAKKLLEARVNSVKEANEKTIKAQELKQRSEINKKEKEKIKTLQKEIIELEAQIKTQTPALKVKTLADLSLRTSNGTKNVKKLQEINFSKTELPLIIENLVEIDFSYSTYEELMAKLQSKQFELAQTAERLGLNKDDILGDLERREFDYEQAKNELKIADRIKKDALQDLSEEELYVKFCSATEDVKNLELKIADLNKLVGLKQDYDPEEIKQEKENIESELSRINKEIGSVSNQRQQIEKDLEANYVDQKELEAKADKLIKEQAEILKIYDLESLTNEIEKIDTEITDSQKQIQPLKEKLDQFDIETIELKKNTLEAEINHLRSSANNKGHEKAKLIGFLDQLESRDLQAEKNNAEAKLATLQRELDKEEKNARAVKLLYETFREFRDRAKVKYIGPYKKAVEKYAKLIWGNNVAVEIKQEDFSIQKRIVNSQDVGFDQLSVGAQEQLVLLAKLACASIIADNTDSEISIPLMLDDVLNNSDENRVENLIPALHEASKKLQIIILTCSPERFNLLPATSVDLTNQLN
jgi:DNA repair exonuclease SbcCD ATPase subunit